MKATELLQKQHREIEQLLERHKAAPPEQRQAIRDELATLLVAHTTIEEEHFYPALRRAAPELTMEAIEEHGLADYELARDFGPRGRDERARARAVVLAQVVMSHIQKEERELFRRAEAELTNQELAELGEEMARRFDQVRTIGFKKFLAQAVAANLPRMALRPAARTAKRAAAKRPAAKRAAAKRAAKRPAVKRATAKRATAKRPAVKRATAKRPAAKTQARRAATAPKRAPAKTARGAQATPKRGAQGTAKRGRPQAAARGRGRAGH